MSIITASVWIAVWFFLPAAAANMAPIIAARLPLLKRFNLPLDFGSSWRAVRLFGDHKTWRGLIVGVLVSSATLWLEYRLASHLPYFPLGYKDFGVPTLLPIWLLGPLLGFGALAGDAVKSFFKRRQGMAPGESWFLIDQIDSLLGAMFTSLFVIILPLEIYIAAFILWPLADLLISFVGHKIGLKEAFL